MTAASDTFELVVKKRSDIADEIVEIELGDHSGFHLPPWSPGAHIDLVLGAGMVRQYSLCGDPNDRETWRIAVLRSRDSRGGSAAVHDRLWPGISVSVTGPRNHFVLEAASQYVFLAGGIGITPLLPMMAEAERLSVRWSLVFGGRTESSMPYAQDLVKMYGSDRVTLVPQQSAGLPDLSAAMKVLQPQGLVYCCGPNGLLNAATAIADELLPPGSLRMEHFSPKDMGSAPAAVTFEVVLHQSGKSLLIPPDRSIVEVLEGSGIIVLTSCEEGTCGTCVTGVLEGVPDHRDSVLTDDERASNSVMTICCSRTQGSRLVLDI